MSEDKKPNRESELKKSREEWRQGRKARLAKTHSKAKESQDSANKEMRRPKKERM